ncbi:MAG: hypothetical protein V3U52_03375 [Thermoplasmata archaeon]
MEDFATFDERMGHDLRQLHDYLWSPGWKGDEARLRTDLLERSRELDAFLGADGRLQKNSEALDKNWGRGPKGEALFELLHHTYTLTAATEKLRNGDYQAAAAHAADVAESVSIGICANAGCFPLVEEWESKRIDFETYASKLADALEAKGIERTQDIRHMLIVAQSLGKEWDETASDEAKALAARAAIENTAWCAVASVSVREALGAAPATPYRDIPGLILHIASRL